MSEKLSLRLFPIDGNIRFVEVNARGSQASIHPTTDRMEEFLVPTYSAEGVRDMRIQSVALLIAIALTGSLATAAAAQPVDGDWAGSLKVGNYWAFFTARFDKKEKDLVATIDVPRIPLRSPAEKIVVESSRVLFEAKSAEGGTRLAFDGRLGDASLSGELDFGGAKGAFQLVKVNRAAQDTHGQFVGEYRIGTDRYISITKYNSGNKETWLAYHDSEYGHWGLLYPFSEDAFYFGPVRVSSFPLDLTITFLKDDKANVSGLKLSRNQWAPTVAKRIELHKEESVSFRSGEVNLSGTLLTPLARSPHPAVVIVHGSGAESRDGTLSTPNYSRHVANLFARNGVAVLAYDKRGVGASTGNWSRASFDDLASDVIAAVQFLKTRDDISPKQVGVWGISQAGWVISSAISQSDEIAFVILVGGGGVSPARQEAYRRELNLRAAGFPEADVEKALVHQQLKFDLVRRDDLEQLNAVNERTKGEMWFQYVSNPEAGDSWTFWRGVIDFDPVPLWKKCKSPVLLIFGELDESSPVAESIDNIGKALNEGRNSDFKSVVQPKADHILLMNKADEKDYPHLSAGAFGTMTDWVLKRVSVRPVITANAGAVTRRVARK